MSAASESRGLTAETLVCLRFVLVVTFLVSVTAPLGGCCAKPLPEARTFVVGLSVSVADAQRGEVKLPAALTGSRVVYHSRAGRLAVVRATLAEPSLVRGHPGVAYVEPDVPLRLLSGVTGGSRVARPTSPTTSPAGHGVPNDPRYSEQPNLMAADIDAQAAWARGETAARVVIAAIDSGIDASHEDLQQILHINDAERTGEPGKDDDGNGLVDDVRGWNFVAGNDDVSDRLGHGTFGAGVGLARGNNDLGIAGVCWSGKVLAIRVLDDQGSTDLANLVAAIYYAVDRGAKVIETDVGGAFRAPPASLLAAVEYARSRGAILVCPAGRKSTDGGGVYPPDLPLPNVIAVVPTRVGTRNVSDDYDPETADIAAPGWPVLGPQLGGGYRQGWSAAAWHVAAALALVWDRTADGGGPPPTADDRVARFLRQFSERVSKLEPHCKDGRFLKLDH